MKKMNEEQVKKVQKIGEKAGIDNLGPAMKSVTDHMATPADELSMIDEMVLNDICPDCKGQTITVSCKKLKELDKCKLK